jgi:SAM-dependent methyltransferase
VADDETLDLAPGAHDLVIHALCLHWANDPVGQLVQCRRALRPDGFLLATLFGGETLADLRRALAEAEARLAGGLSPRVAPMAEIRDLGALLQRAGFAMPVADAERLTVTYATPLHLMRELRAMGETNILSARRRQPLRRATLTRACEIYASHFATAEGRVRATFEIVFLTGWAPAPDQPQPLRPGSANARLADALGVPEVSTGEKAGK